MNRLCSTESTTIGGDFFHHHYHFRRIHSCTTILFRDEHTEPPPFAENVYELVGVLARVDALAPVRPLEVLAYLPDTALYQSLLLREGALVSGEDAIVLHSYLGGDRYILLVGDS